MKVLPLLLILLGPNHALACDGDLSNLAFEVNASVSDGVAYFDILVPIETDKFYEPSANFVSPHVRVPLNNGYLEGSQIYFGVSGDPKFLETSEIEINYSVKPVESEHGLGVSLCRLTRTITWRNSYTPGA